MHPRGVTVAAASAAVVGSSLIHDDGIDFHLPLAVPVVARAAVVTAVVVCAAPWTRSRRSVPSMAILVIRGTWLAVAMLGSVALVADIGPLT